jgi:cytochrome P450
MQTLALRIVGKTLFDEEMSGDTQRIASAIEAFMGFLPLVFLPFSEAIQKLPIPLMQRIRRSRVELDELIFRIIGERRAAGIDRGDLLSMLLAAEDTEENTGGMSDSQVRDECVTALLAGNETTANALSFSLWLLATHPEAQQRLHAEASAVLGGRVASAEDYPRLRYAYLCFAETMRLYPPVWITARTAAETYPYRGFTIAEGSLLLAPQFVLHHDERFWPEPERFDPLRFSEEARVSRPKLSYFPFAAGSRQCIGEGLAWMEGVLSLATMARNWRFSLPANAPRKLAVQAQVSLRPKGALPLRLERWTE